MHSCKVLSIVERITYVCMDMAPANNKSDALWLRQETEGRISGRRENFGIEPGRRFTGENMIRQMLGA